MAIITLLALTLLLGLITRAIYSRYLSPIADIPGPFLASISRLWLAQRVIQGDMITHIRDLHRKHGSLVRIAPNEISVVEEQAVKQIYGVGAGYQKSTFYAAMGDANALENRRDLFSIRDERRHSQKRRHLAHLYTMSNILKAEECLDECLADCSALLNDHALHGTILDLGAALHRYTFDAVGVFFFGQPFGFQRERRDVDGMMDILTLRTRQNAFFGVFPFVRRFRRLLEWAVPVVRRAIRQNQQLLQKATQVVDARLKLPLPGRRDMLKSVIDVHVEKPDSLTQREVVTEAYSAIAAGNDSTATALRSVFYYLMRNPSSMLKLQQEIDTAIREGRLSEPIKYNEACSLPYLSAVIKESMRMFPSVGLTLPRVVPLGGTTIGGKHIPAGFVVGINAHALHFDRSVFGDDADEFNPARWLDSPEVVRLRMDRCFFEFGFGSRACIGKNLAMCEIYRLVPHVMRDFELKLVDQDHEWKTEGGWFTHQQGIDVLVTKRESKL